MIRRSKEECRMLKNIDPELLDRLLNLDAGYYINSTKSNKNENRSSIYLDKWKKNLDSSQ